MRILIYTPYKVGSSTLSRRLRTLLACEEVWEGRGRAEILARHRKAERLIVRGHTSPVGALVGTDGLSFDAWITLVRDPYALYPSAWFQDIATAAYPYSFGSEQDVRRAGTDALMRHFLSFDWSSFPQTSLDFNFRAVQEVCGIDLWRAQFRPEVGWQVHTTACRAVRKLGLMRLDKLDDPAAWTEFLRQLGLLAAVEVPRLQALLLGRPGARRRAIERVVGDPCTTDNTARKKWYAPQYRRFLRALPEVYYTRYAPEHSRYARAFHGRPRLPRPVGKHAPHGLRLATRRALPGIRYYSWRPGCGIGDAAARMMQGLRRRGIPVMWTPVVYRDGANRPHLGAPLGDGALDAICNSDIPYETVIVHAIPEALPAIVARERGRQLVAYLTWETDTLPRHWPALLCDLDQLVVPCRWNQEVFSRAGVSVPITVVPHIAHDFGESRWDTSAGIVFYTIGRWNRRKAIAKTLRCYLEAFSVADPVRFLIKSGPEDTTHDPPALAFLPPRLRDRLRYAYKRRVLTARARFAGLLPAAGPPVELHTDTLPEQGMRGLHRGSHCFLSLCHAEGWGLGAFDAASCGNPVIITDYGGQLDFLPRELAYLVPAREGPVGRAMAEFGLHEQRWGFADPRAAVEILRRILREPEEARERGLALRRHILERFAEQPVIDRLLRAIGRGP